MYLQCIYITWPGGPSGRHICTGFFNRNQHVYTYQALASLGHNAFATGHILTANHVRVWGKVYKCLIRYRRAKRGVMGKVGEYPFMVWV